MDERRTDLAERVALLEQSLSDHRAEARRQLGLLRSQLGRVEKTVTDMTAKEAIADAVADRLARDRLERRDRIFTRPYKVIAAGLALVVSVSAVASFTIQVWPS